MTQLVDDLDRLPEPAIAASSPRTVDLVHALLADASVVCWGDPDGLGDAVATPEPTPVLVAP